MNRGERARRRAVVVAALVATLGAGCADDGARPTDRQADVAARGESVMPFDLERTTHRFAKTGTGGVQTVVADDPHDATHVSLIREHLAHEAERFRRGDFADPARIHGDGMPGLATLRANAGSIAVDYASTEDGGRITYTTTDATLVAALHAWFDAQVDDHGSHATPG